MKQRLQQLAEKFNALQQRERVLVLVASVVIIVLMFFNLIIDPVQQQINQTNKQVNDLQSQTAQLEKQIQTLQASQQLDPNQEEKRKLTLLETQLKQINDRLKEKMRGLIEPAQMAKVLEAVLTQSTDLKLERIQSLGAKPLLPKTEPQATAQDEQEQQDLGIYRHGMEVEFSGSYLSTLKYLQALEALSWDFYWDGLTLTVEKYPMSRIVIKVHTLSFHEGWIGV